MPKFAKKVDANHAYLRDSVFRKLCPIVRDTSKFGSGFPDLLIKTRRGTVLGVEIKETGGCLNANELSFRQDFPTFYRVCFDEQDAIRISNE